MLPRLPGIIMVSDYTKAEEPLPHLKDSVPGKTVNERYGANSPAIVMP